jgi:hypothetical protein
MDRRHFAALSSAAMVGLIPQQSRANSSGSFANSRETAAKQLVSAYYDCYNRSLWGSIEKLFDDPCYFHSNSGYDVIDRMPKGEFGAGHEETAGHLSGVDKIVGYLRTRRSHQKNGFYIEEDGSQLYCPLPSIVMAWMSKPDAASRIGLPLHEVHVFQCNFDSVGEATLSSKIAVVHEINLQNFEIVNG